VEIIEHRLKSDSNKTVKVPKEYAEWAETIVKSAMSGISSIDLDKMIEADRYLQTYEFAASVLKLGEMKPGTERSNRMQDIVYLSVCRAYCFDRVGERDGKEGIDLGMYLTKIIESL
jgi:hypothetical protein